MLALADGDGASGAPGRGFQQAGFASFERIWTGQQVRCHRPSDCRLLAPACSSYQTTTTTPVAMQHALARSTVCADVVSHIHLLFCINTNVEL